MADYIFHVDLSKKVLKELESFSGKVVNIKFSNHLKEKIPAFSIWLEDSSTAKTIRLSRWNAEKRTREDFNIKLISKDFRDSNWPRFDLESFLKRG